MAFWKRVFSADFRRGLAAEAAGDYGAAARAYALAGERAKVAEMHLYAAERAGAGDARLVELRAGIRWADEHADEGLAMRRRLARALLGHVRHTGVISESDRALLREAATLFASAGDHAGAGECHELSGDESLAAESYGKAGEVERLEAVLSREEDRRGRDNRQRDAYAEYQLHLAAGARDQARASLETALRSGGDSQSRHLLDSLDEKLLTEWQVTLAVGTGKPVRHVGSFPLVLGREPGCQLMLRDVGVSRRHAEVLESGGRFRLRDAGSRNGTSLGGVTIGGELPLDGEGEIGVGDHCRLRFRAAAGALALEIVAGLDRGLHMHASAAPVPVGDGAAELRFVAGRPHLHAAAGRTLKLNKVRTAGAVQLIRGDHVEIGGGEPVITVEVA